MSIIGLRVYKISLYKDHVPHRISNDAGHQDVLSSFRSFANRFGRHCFDNGNSKTFRVIPETASSNVEHGILRYGTYGFGAEVEDVATGTVTYNRLPTEAETIPIYYRLWAVGGYPYALMGIQSYGNRSCVDLFRQAFRDFFRGNHADFSMEIEKLVPNERKIYGNQVVKKIALVKRKEPRSSLRPELRPDNCSTVDLELSITPQTKGNFGRLKDIDDRLGGYIIVDDVEYEGAFATVRVGNTTKRIGVLGLSSSAGVIDITNDVSLDTSNHPEIGSISRVFNSHMADFAAGLGG